MHVHMQDHIAKKSRTRNPVDIKHPFMFALMLEGLQVASKPKMTRS